MHLLWDAQRQAGTGYAYVQPFHIDTINCHEDYQHYTDVTSALDYRWTGIMDMEILLFLIEDTVTGCKSIV